MPKVKLLRNMGAIWHKDHGVPLVDGKPFQVGSEHDVSKEIAALLIKDGLVEVHGVAEAAPVKGVSKKDEK